MTRDEIIARYPRCSESFIHRNLDEAEAGTDPAERADHDRVEESCPESEPIICGELEDPVSDQKASPGRYTVCIESRRCRLLDPDNLVGGVKFFVDSLRYYRVIPDDNPKVLRLIVFQTKVRSKAEEKTVITVTPPPTSL